MTNMKRALNIIIASFLIACSLSATADDDCTIDVSVANVTKGDAVPPKVQSSLEAKLATALSAAGMCSADYDAQFFVAGRFDNAIIDIVGGTSQQYVVKTTLTIYIGDANEKRVFDSKSFDLKGVGTTKELAYKRCLGGLSASNKALRTFLSEGKQKILAYFESNYPSYISKAKRAMISRNYDEALSLLAVIPSCCSGYDQACELAMQIATDNIDYIGAQLLAAAQGAWAADPTADGASVAHYYLRQIDPNSACYADAQKLSKTISTTTQKQWEFENITKYNNEIAYRKQAMLAARDIAVAQAKNRPKVVNRYYFVW